MSSCVNHPDRPAVIKIGMIDVRGVCLECFEEELARIRAMEKNLKQALRSASELPE